jgi:peptidoglycan/xylan/chitin deacetylase (PgdA/CDA1 family)
MGAAPRAIPVIMYHGVGDDYPGWIWNHLVIPVNVFEEQMRSLREDGWTTITLDELYAHMSTGASVPAKPILLTFDDGYRDNYVNAFPILKKYGHRGVIWMSTDFIDPRTDLPPTLEDVWAKRVGREELDARGYLSWAEMRRMIASGHIDIQSHAKTHTWYFSGPEIVDFHRPDGVDGYTAPLWLAWNSFPAEKYKSMHERMGNRLPYGQPIYRHGKSFEVRRFFEDPRLTERLIAFVGGNGRGKFFSRPGWRGELERVAREFGARAERVETDGEYRARVIGELGESRRAIETALGTRVRFLCWPGGAQDAAVRALAEEVGYVATTSLYDDPTKRNVFGEDPRDINRIGSGSPWMYRGAFIKRTSAGFFRTGLDLFLGKPFSIWRYRSYKLLYALRYQVTGRT